MISSLKLMMSSWQNRFQFQAAVWFAQSNCVRKIFSRFQEHSLASDLYNLISLTKSEAKIIISF